MRKWAEDLSDWIESKEPVAGQPMEEEVHQALLETDALLEAGEDLMQAYEQMLEKAEHVRS